MTGDLVLVHGWGMSRRVWEPVIDALSGLHRVHNLDLPGYGRADPAATRYPDMGGGEILDQWSDACLAAAPAAALWMGWSLGALLVMNAALRRPDRIAAAVLVSATPKFLRGGDWEAGVEPSVLRGFVDGVLNGDDRTLKRFLTLQAGGTDDVRRLGRALAGCLAARDLQPAVLEAGLKVLEESDLRASVPALEIPLMVIHGAGDRILPPSAGWWIARQAPRAERVSLDTGHAPLLTRPREIARAVQAWH